MATGSAPGQRAALRSQVGHPLRTPFYGGVRAGIGDCPSGAEGIRTQIPLSPLPLSGVGTEKWVGSIDSAPEGRVVPAAVGIGRVPGTWRLA